MVTIVENKDGWTANIVDVHPDENGDKWSLLTISDDGGKSAFCNLYVKNEEEAERAACVMAAPLMKKALESFVDAVKRAKGNPVQFHAGLPDNAAYLAELALSIANHDLVPHVKGQKSEKES